jgi:hypothetical protein
MVSDTQMRQTTPSRDRAAFADQSSTKVSPYGATDLRATMTGNPGGCGSSLVNDLA